jgi:hypothetical protein
MGVNRFVAISGGKDSTAMALRLVEVEPDDYTFLITPTGRELPPMEEHWRKLEERLGKPLCRVPAPSLLDLIKRYQALPNWRMRWCTRQIKIEPFMAYVANHLPAISYVGIRADEAQRGGTLWTEDEVVQDFPLVRWGWGIDKVKRYLVEQDCVPPARTDCDICFFQRLIEWYELWRDYPELYQEATVLELWTGHTFRSPSRDTWPASLAELAVRFEMGEIPKDTRSKTREAMCAWCAR